MIDASAGASEDRTRLPLAGVGVLVTRAVHQADGLCALIHRWGGEPIRFPALEIQGAAGEAELQRFKDRIRRFDLAVFVSPNAVRYGAGILSGVKSPRPMIAAVGGTTAQGLADVGLAADIVPQDRFDSEALLETPALRRVAGKKVLIVRGNGGRPLLGDSLAERGADVVYLEVYRRARPVTDPGPLLQRWESGVQVVTATSNDILVNLHAMLGAAGRTKLVGTPVVVVGDRMQQKARELGHRRIVVAARADDGMLIEALRGWAQGRTAPG